MYILYYRARKCTDTTYYYFRRFLAGFLSGTNKGDGQSRRLALRIVFDLTLYIIFPDGFNHTVKNSLRIRAILFMIIFNVAFNQERLRG